jgi:4'-phosphopantetheinyl transferase
MVITNGKINSRFSSSLMDGEVVIWYASLDQPAAVLGELATVLSEEELTRAGRFHFKKHQDAFIAARGMLRFLLSWHTGIHPRDLQFHYTEYGKPTLAGLDFHFNLSHSGSIVLYALSPDRRVGIDIEQTRPLQDLDQIAKNYFSPQEYRQFCSLREDEKLTAFFRCWTRKEAFIKAIGEGISFPLQEFDVSLKPGYPAKLLHVRGSAQDAEGWSLHHLEILDGYAAAIVVEGSKHTLLQQGWIDLGLFNTDWSKP